jgi:CheY-like chemotaxis protein
MNEDKGKRFRRILYVEDNEHWCAIVGQSLRGAGFQVTTANSGAEAEKHLSESFYHLAVLDLSLEQSRSNNAEGMGLLEQWDQRGLLGAMSVVMLTAHATLEILRKAFRDHQVAEFLDKHNFDNVEFSKVVEEVFASRVGINLALDIQWEIPGGPKAAVLEIKLGAENVDRDSAQQLNVAEQLDDLLCRLFDKAEALQVTTLAPNGASPGVLLVQPFYPDGAGMRVIVKFGDTRTVASEYDHFKEHVQPFIASRGTNIVNVRRTPLVGGIVYSLFGSVGDHIESFCSFYSGASVPQISETLVRLFYETCGAWYANQGSLQLRDLSGEYRETLGFTEGNLWAALSHLKGVQGKSQLHFDSLGTRSFTNPISVNAERQFKIPTYACITHGNLNGDNILIDDSGHAWLIDFEQTGPGHILRDIVGLDAVVRFQLLRAEEASLVERLKMEEILCSVKHLSDVENLVGAFQTENSKLSKAYATTVQLRTIARQLLSRNPNADLNEYYVALLYYSLNALRFSSLSDVQREHALLAASFLSERLS